MATTTKQPEVKKWQGIIPANCELCHNPLTTTFSDVATCFAGNPWAILCPICAQKFGIGYGEGKGQQYDVKTGIKLLG